jgi:guanylate kinase
MLLLISGPSGAGKSTFTQALLESENDVDFSVSTTTRKIRGGEVDGIQYHFVDDAKFDSLIEADAFVEYADVHKFRYGTRKAHIAQMVADGKIPLLDLDVQGGHNVIDIYGEELVSVFIFPPSWEVLEQRLRARGTDSDEVIKTRLENARWEIGFAEKYDYIIVNDDLDKALSEMKAILTAERCRRIRQSKMPLK